MGIQRRTRRYELKNQQDVDRLLGELDAAQSKAEEDESSFDVAQQQATRFVDDVERELERPRPEPSSAPSEFEEARAAATAVVDRLLKVTSLAADRTGKRLDDPARQQLRKPEVEAFDRELIVRLEAVGVATATLAAIAEPLLPAFADARRSTSHRRSHFRIEPIASDSAHGTTVEFGSWAVWHILQLAGGRMRPRRRPTTAEEQAVALSSLRQARVHEAAWSWLTSSLATTLDDEACTTLSATLDVEAHAARPRLPDWKSLTPVQQRIVTTLVALAHLSRYPTQPELAKGAGCERDERRFRKDLGELLNDHVVHHLKPRRGYRLAGLPPGTPRSLWKQWRIARGLPPRLRVAP